MLTPDFELAASEFVRQADILEALVRTVDVSAGQDGMDAIMVGEIALPVIPSGGQNTMAAAAIVLLAAHFEEYIRQQVEEYAKLMLNDFEYIKPANLEKIVDQYWRAGTSKLVRIRPKGSSGWAGRAEPILRGLIEYPVSSNTACFQANMLSEHQNNMRWDTVLELTQRLAITKLDALIFKDNSLKALLGSPKADARSQAIRAMLNDFYELRNGIVHSIAQNSGIGAPAFSQWIVFFRTFAPAFVRALDEAFLKFSSEVSAVKGVPA